MSQPSETFAATTAASGDDPRRLEAAIVSAVEALVDDLVLVIDPAGHIVRANSAFERLTGYTASELRGRTFWSLFLSLEDRAVAREMLRTLTPAQFPRTDEADWHTRSAGPRRIRWRSVATTDASGAIQHIVGVGTDVTLARSGEMLERDRADVLEMVAQSCPLDDTLRRIVQLTETQRADAKVLLVLQDESPFGAQREARIITSDRQLGEDEPLSPTDAANLRHWEQLVRQCGGGVCWSVRIRSAQNEPLGTLGVHTLQAREPTDEELRVLEEAARLASLAIEHQMLADQLTRQALHDQLTGLPNRLLLDQRLDRSLLRAHHDRSMLALLMLDVDGFKTINDTLGHQGGDKALQLIAQRLQNALRPTDTLVRVAGDEFTVIAPNVSTRDNAGRVGQRLLDALREPFDVGGREFYLSASIGIAVYPEDGVDVEALQRNADAALYRAKNLGRSRYEIFSPELNAEVMERAELVADLRRAIQENRLELFYQPKVDRTGRICGLEALLRWRHPTRGFVPPAKFIPLAEEHGLIVSIGTWVLNEACRQASEWARVIPNPPKIAANVSALQFAQTTFVETLVESLRRHGTPPGLLELELTESLVMDHASDGLGKLAKVREMGVGIAIDDFGTGYSSLSYLNRLPIDTLKIDRSFVSELSPDVEPTDQRTAVIRAITSLALNLRLKLVAEGVETECQRQFLLGIGCHEMQGFLFSPARPAPEIATLLRNRRHPMPLALSA